MAGVRTVLWWGDKKKTNFKMLKIGRIRKKEMKISYHFKYHLFLLWLIFFFVCVVCYYFLLFEVCDEKGGVPQTNEFLAFFFFFFFSLSVWAHINQNYSHTPLYQKWCCCNQGNINLESTWTIKLPITTNTTLL